MPNPISASSPDDFYRQCLDYCFQKNFTNCTDRCGAEKSMPEEASKPFSWSDHRTVQAMATIANPYTITGMFGTGFLIEGTGGWIGGSVTAATLLLPVGTSAYYHYDKYSAGEETEPRALAHVAGDAVVSGLAHIGGTISGLGVGLAALRFAPLSPSTFLVSGAVGRTAATAGIVYYLTDPMDETIDHYMDFIEWQSGKFEGR
ncbi:MAG: hypothetical protein HYU99_09060 [Deltaproteobacteria bacterium]|nr:hypothetical protein [Deltaproteobacteria bacterium]